MSYWGIRGGVGFGVRDWVEGLTDLEVGVSACEGDGEIGGRACFMGVVKSE